MTPPISTELSPAFLVRLARRATRYIVILRRHGGNPARWIEHRRHCMQLARLSRRAVTP